MFWGIVVSTTICNIQSFLTKNIQNPPCNSNVVFCDNLILEILKSFFLMQIVGIILCTTMGGINSKTNLNDQFFYL